MNMKRILIYILSAAVCLLTSCEKEKTLAEKLMGDWHCTAVSTEAEIYATFTAENTFVLYQQIGEGAFRVYNGTYELAVQDGTDALAVLTGRYNDGTEWGASYKVTSLDDTSMTLAAEGVTETYTRIDGGIPEEVTASCVTVVKSESDEEAPFL